MAAHLGAHEVLETHEILNNAIVGIHQLQLYRPHVKDQQLAQIVDKHLQFMINEYNGMIQTLNQRGMGQAVPYQAPANFTPTYGLRQPMPHAPNMNANQIDDRDAASGALACHKASAMFKMLAALECADPGLRRMMQQSATNCSEMAYEVWQYMNQKGYYQSPTMKEMTTNTMIHSYQQAPPTPMSNASNAQGNMMTQSDIMRTYM